LERAFVSFVSFVSFFIDQHPGIDENPDRACLR